MENLNNVDYNNNQTYQLSLSTSDLRGMAGWATFKAVIDIISGALSCLGFIFILPAVYGVMRILAGVKLLNAADDVKRYIESNDNAKVADAFANLNRHFKFTGIGIIIQICSAILLIILYGILIATLAPLIEEIIRGSGYPYYY